MINIRRFISHPESRVKSARGSEYTRIYLPALLTAPPSEHGIFEGETVTDFCAMYALHRVMEGISWVASSKLSDLSQQQIIYSPMAQIAGDLEWMSVEPIPLFAVPLELLQSRLRASG